MQSAFAALPPPVERLQGRAPVAELVAMFCRAFADDPHFNWLIRQDAGRASALKGLFELLLTDMAAAHGHIFATSDRKAAMIVYPPGGWCLDWPAQARFLRHYLAIAGFARIVSRGIGLNIMEGRHPREPHFVLQLLGVDPEWRRRGYGRVLLEALIADSERVRRPIYLETGSTENLAFYRRFGFGVRSENRLPGGLRLWAMVREAGTGALPPA